MHRYTDILLVSQDITNIHRVYAGCNAKLDLVLNTLKDYRANLCAFHTTKMFSFGKTSSQLSECQNSQIKGGNSYSRWLRCQSYIETILHIVASMQLYIDETITRIKTCVNGKKCFSPWIEAKLQTVSPFFDIFLLSVYLNLTVSTGIATYQQVHVSSSKTARNGRRRSRL